MAWSFGCKIGTLCLGVFAGLYSSAEALRSPWDLHPVGLTDGAYACPSLPVLPHTIIASSYYTDRNHSIVDEQKKAAYNEAHKLYTEVDDKTAKAADAFQKTGSRAAAACVIGVLAEEARADAMTGSKSSNQAQYVQNWTLGALAISWLKVRDARAGTPEQMAVIEPWLRKNALQVKDYFQQRHEKQTSDGRNNHFYWAGFSVMASGIALNDRALYEWGESTYKDGVDRIQADGTLPLEMGRGQRALHYHLFALAPLVTMAELGEANGEDLYAYDGNKLHLLVSRSMAGLVDNSYFTQKAGVAQDTPEKGGIRSEDLEWVAPYLRRFPDPTIASLLKQAGSRPYGYLGGLPPP